MAQEVEQPVVQQRQQQKSQQQASVIDKAPAEQQQAPGDLKSQVRTCGGGLAETLSSCACEVDMEQPPCVRVTQPLPS